MPSSPTAQSFTPVLARTSSEWAHLHAELCEASHGSTNEMLIEFWANRKRTCPEGYAMKGNEH